MFVCISLLFGGGIKVYITGSSSTKEANLVLTFAITLQKNSISSGDSYQRGDRIVHTLTVKDFKAILEMYTKISGSH